MNNYPFLYPNLLWNCYSVMLQPSFFSNFHSPHFQKNNNTSSFNSSQNNLEQTESAENIILSSENQLSSKSHFFQKQGNYREANYQSTQPEKNKGSSSPIIIAFNGEVCKQMTGDFTSFGEENESDSRDEECKRAKLKQDHEYTPKFPKKKIHKSKYQQNENRNIIPNEINQILSFVQKKSKSGYLVQKLLSRLQHPETYNSKRFYLYQSLLKNKISHYTNEKTLKIMTEIYDPHCDNWSRDEQLYYNKICRILVRHFLYEDSIFIILTSKRMKKEKKMDHLKVRRYICNSAAEILRG